MSTAEDDTEEAASKECYLINADISDCASLNISDQSITILNLHCNKLTSLLGLPDFQHLVELNLSSNEFSDVNVKELVQLRNLKSLDMSGNYITKLDSLPYIPSLEIFSVAFNKISNLNGLDGFPSLKSLDIRGNALSEVESFHAIQVLSSLRNIQISNADGRHANPICGRDQDILKVFDCFVYMGTIDNKSRQDHANFLTEKTFGFDKAPSSKLELSSRIELVDKDESDQPQQSISQAKSEDTKRNMTPKFDKAVERFRHRLQQPVPISPIDELEDSGRIGGVEVFIDNSDEESESNLSNTVVDNSMFSTSEHSHPTFPSVKSPTRNNVASVSSKSPIRDSNIPSIDVSNPWKEDNLKDNRVTKLLEKSKVTSIVSKSPSSRKEIAPPISPPQKSDDLVVSPGDDDSFAMSFKDSKCPAEISSKKSLTKFSYELVVLASKVESRNLSLKVSFRIWKMSSQLLQSKQVNSDLTEQLHSREKARLQSNAEYDKRVESLERKLHDEETRNSALQDRLITMEQDNVARVNEHMAKQEALSTQLEVQKEMLKDAQDNLSQHEKKYSQSLQDITSDVVQFTKVMESKDDNIASLLSTKDKMENEIHELRAENKDLVSSRENFVCPDCTKMKTFFDTMQHDMQHLMEKKVQLEHENAQIPVLTDQLASLREKLTVTQLDFTKQVSEMQQKSQGMVAQSVVVELENKYTEQLREKEAAFVAKEKMLQDCLREVASAKDALMEYDDKCMEMEDLLKKSQAQNSSRKDVDSELERLRLDLKKNQSDMKKKDILISEMREHVLEVKTMLKKLADKCRSLEYVNETQHCDLLDAQSEISRLEDELSAAVELKNESVDHPDNIVSANILACQNSQDSENSSPDNEPHLTPMRHKVDTDEPKDDDANKTLTGIEGDNEVSRQVFDELLSDYEQLQRDYDVQTERLHELETHLHDASASKHDGELDDTLMLSVDGFPMSTKELHDTFLNKRTEYEESLKDMTVSLRIKDKMIDDQNNAIRRLKERHREDESRVQETISILEEENEEIRNELLQLEEQLDQSRQQEKHCLKEIRTFEEERQRFQDECKAAASDDIKRYRSAIQEKDNALEKVRQELTSICEVVSDMKSKGCKKDNEIKHLRKEIEVISKETEKETNKYLTEKSAKDRLLKDVQKMRSEISQSLINKENTIKDLKKSLKNKKVLLLESHEKISHMEQLFGTFQQLAATISAPSKASTKHATLSRGDYSLHVPSHLLLNEGALAQTIEKYSDANKRLKESISDMSVVSSDSENEISDTEENENNDNYQDRDNEKSRQPTDKHKNKTSSGGRHHTTKHSSSRLHAKPILQSKSPDRSKIPKRVKKISGNQDGPLGIDLPATLSSPRHIAGRSYTDIELSTTNSANILELSKSDDFSLKSIREGSVGGSIDKSYKHHRDDDRVDNIGNPAPSNAINRGDDEDQYTNTYHDEFYARYASDMT